MRRGLTDLKKNVNVRRESSEQRALASWLSLDELVGLVMTHYGCERQELMRRHNRGFEPRQVLLYLAAMYCRGRYSLCKLADELGHLTVGGLCAARYKLSKRLQARDETELRNAVKTLGQTIGDSDKLK